jgi:hypothetical protein
MHAVARATGWTLNEVRVMMMPGGPLDPTNPNAAKRIADLINRGPVSGLGWLR